MLVNCVDRTCQSRDCRRCFVFWKSQVLILARMQVILLFLRSLQSHPVNASIVTWIRQWTLPCFFPLWRCGPTRAVASSFTRFLDHTQRHTTVGRTPLDEWSARRKDLYLTTHNTHNRQTSKPLEGFELTISAGEWPQTYAVDRAANGTGTSVVFTVRYWPMIVALDAVWSAVTWINFPFMLFCVMTPSCLVDWRFHIRGA